jgi:hypothetical protein
MPEEKRYRTTGPAVVSETVDDETIIVDLETGSYYDLNAAGGCIWSLVTRGHTPEDSASELVSRFGADADEARRAVDALVARLLEEGLLAELPPEAAVTPNGAAPGELSNGARYEPPVLHKHSDMQDLLLLDPIHEVDETGWPSRA